MSYTYLLEGGGGILGGMLCGNTCVCAVEIEPYCRKVILQRQRDGILPKFPVWDDVRTFDGKPWRGHVDIICGGFPCQDISAAGKGAGITGERSGLWKEFARIIGEVRPNYVLVENSPMLTLRGLGVVLGDLAALGYDAQWCVLGAVDAGAPHKRDRIWILANPRSERGFLPIERQFTTEQITRGPGTEGSTRTTDVADTESQQDNGRGRGHLDDTPCSRESCNTATCSSCEDVANSNEIRLQRSRQDRDVAGQTGLRSGKGSDKDECVCNATSEGLPNRRSTQMGEPGEIEELERSGSSDVSNPWQDRDEQRIRELREVEQTARDGFNNGRGTTLNEIGQWWAVEPDVGRVAHGVASRVDRLKAIGNGQVPAVVKLAWDILTKGIPT